MIRVRNTFVKRHMVSVAPGFWCSRMETAPSGLSMLGLFCSEPVRRISSAHLWESRVSTESEWDTSIVQAAAFICGCRVVSASHGGHPRTLRQAQGVPFGLWRLLRAGCSFECRWGNGSDAGRVWWGHVLIHFKKILENPPATDGWWGGSTLSTPCLVEDAVDSTSDA